MTLVDRHTSCILAWRVAAQREEALLQAMVDEAHKPSSITATCLPPIATWSKHLDATPSCPTKVRPIASKAIMLNCATTWRASLVEIDLSPVPFTLYFALSNYLSLPGIDAKSIISAFLPIRLLFWISFVHDLHHSLCFRIDAQTVRCRYYR